MLCDNCGHYLPDGEKQCFHCGAIQGEYAETDIPKHGARNAGRARGGPNPRVLILILVVLIIAALAVWALVYARNKPADDAGTAPISSEEAPSVVSMQVSGDTIGHTEQADILLVDQAELYLCSPATGEAERICGLSDKGKRILSAAYCNDYVYFIEQSDSYNYLYRVSPSADSEVQKLRVNDKGAQMRTQMEQLMAVNGKLCGFARYPQVKGVSEAYVELYQLNAEGVYRSSDTSTKILYTTQNVQQAKGNDPARYSVQPSDTGITVLYDGETVAECAVD